MKTFQSNVENVWTELVIVPLTQAQITLMKSNASEDAVAKATLRQTIKASREAVVSPEKTTVLNAFYLTKKPVLAEGDTYELISADVTEKIEGAFSGIFNCRVNGEHKQVRF
jgi:hypothetical protein